MISTADWKRGGRPGYIAAIAQLCKVNGITVQEAGMLYRRAMDKWKQRSKRGWRVVVAKPLIERYPELTVLEPNTNLTLF